MSPIPFLYAASFTAVSRLRVNPALAPPGLGARGPRPTHMLRRGPGSSWNGVIELTASAGLIHSVGHGARPLDEMFDILDEAGVRQVVDIRTAPRSRRYPHFDRTALHTSLQERGIAYAHLRGLGGWRRARPDSPHVALRVPGFRGYADHLSSAEFARDYETLQALAREAPTAYMCAETYWWRCHRKILSDRLVVDGWEVVHLIRTGERQPHGLSRLACLSEGQLLYNVASDDYDVASDDGRGTSAGTPS